MIVFYEEIEDENDLSKNRAILNYIDIDNLKQLKNEWKGTGTLKNFLLHKRKDILYNSYNFNSLNQYNYKRVFFHILDNAFECMYKLRDVKLKQRFNKVS